MKQVVSVSLGTSTRDKETVAELFGEQFSIARKGYDGDMAAYANAFKELDGKVDALGVGGADIFLRIENKTFTFAEIKRVVANAKTTPVVDGSGLKHTLERKTIEDLQSSGVVDFKNSKTLLVSAVDRFGMAQALEKAGGKVTYGDLLFGMGLNIPIRDYKHVLTLGNLTLPLITRLPFKWFYPTGKQQEVRKPKYPKEFLNADIIAGDWHYIRRYMPDELPGKTIITQTVRKADIDFLTKAKVHRLITTTPNMGGETFATNVMEACIVAHFGKGRESLPESVYLDALKELSWNPQVLVLNP